MTETLDVRLKPSTPETLLVTSPSGTLEWHPQFFKMIFGRGALVEVYASGRITVTREAIPDVQTATAAA